MVQDATQRMTPVDMRSPRLHALPMLLEDFVGKQEDDNDEGYNQKRAQYYVFDHDNLLVVKRCGSIVAGKLQRARQVITWSCERRWAAARILCRSVRARAVMAEHERAGGLGQAQARGAGRRRGSGASRADQVQAGIANRRPQE